jgi:hypothetical protein
MVSNIAWMECAASSGEETPAGRAPGAEFADTLVGMDQIVVPLFIVD